jgi:hypothetical protein
MPEGEGRLASLPTAEVVLAALGDEDREDLSRSQKHKPAVARASETPMTDSLA